VRIGAVQQWAFLGREVVLADDAFVATCGRRNSRHKVEHHLEMVLF
jgi:hypothetical protein